MEKASKGEGPASCLGDAGPLLLVLSGPSGVGKDSVLKRMQDLGVPLYYAVTVTTRPRRPEEVDGVDYRFVTPAEYRAILESGGFLEHANVYGNLYGIPKEPIREALAQGRDVIVRIDVQGAATIRRVVPEAVQVFLAPPSLEALEERLRQRKTERPDALQVRIQKAREEMQALSRFDYVVVNEDEKLDAAVERILAIISAEKCRVCRKPVRL
ncbi:MAG TPA: guanylate kinase [Dehalococcoidia bacterium]